MQNSNNFMVPHAQETQTTCQAALKVYKPYEVHVRHHMRDHQLSGKQTQEQSIHQSSQVIKWKRSKSHKKVSIAIPIYGTHSAGTISLSLSIYIYLCHMLFVHRGLSLSPIAIH